MSLKVLTIEVCGECPAYISDSSAYHDEFGICGRDRSIEVKDDEKPPKTCPLKDWKECK